MTIVLLIGAYLLGSIPFGLILTRLAGLGDIRAIGSGNIGATNVMRTGNKKLAALTLLLDMGKGALAVWLGLQFTNPDDSIRAWPYLLCPLCVVWGHMYPVWLKFKGGKGVATAIGAITMFFPWMGFGIIIVWLAVFYFWRISSLAALISIWAGPILGIFMAHFISNWGSLILLFYVPVVFIALLITFRHRDNIKRLLGGTEPKFGKKVA